MIEFLWVLILVASLIGALNCHPTGDMRRERLRGCVAQRWRWWLVVGIVFLVGVISLWNNVMRTALNLLLFFGRHTMLMVLLLAMSLVGFILAWRGELSLRRLLSGVVLGASVALLLAFNWYCSVVFLLLLTLFGLLLVQKDRLAWLSWVCVLLTTFLGAGLILSRVLYDPSQASFDVADSLLVFGVVILAVLGLIWSWQTQSALFGWVSALMLLLVVGGVVLSRSGLDVPAQFASVADYVLLVLLLGLAFSAMVWVRGLPLQPLGWVSAVLILFLGGGLFFSSILYGEPEDFADIEDQFKYGSIGSDHFLARGIPSFIWEILPKMFPPEDLLVEILPEGVRESEKINYAPRYGKDDEKGLSYEAFGLVREEHKEARLEGEDKVIVIDRPIGFSKRKVFGIDFIGINCAFCHVSTIRKDVRSQPEIVSGMPANTVDIELFFQFLFAAGEKDGFSFFNAGRVMEKIISEDHHPEMRFGKQVGQSGLCGVCREIKNSVHRVAYRLALIPLTGMYARQLKKDFYFIDPYNPDRIPRFGPGRVDAWSPGKTTLVKPPLEVKYPGGIIDDTSIWNQKARDGMRLHWDGNIHILAERNIIAGLVVNGPQIECLDTKRMDRINKWIEARPAPRFDDFVLGYMDVEELVKKREQGRLIFQHWCASCHALGGERIGQVEPVDSEQLKTDPARMLNFTIELANALNTLGTDKWQLRNFRAQNGYANMLLDGIWLRAPYLHNGSVPTLRDLLNIPERRPTQFCRGNDLYDWKNVGFDSAMVEKDGGAACGEFFLYDTSVPGNSNRGHLYGTDLKEDEKELLIEFLKTL